MVASSAVESSRSNHMTIDSVPRVTPRRTDELMGRATLTVQKDQARVPEFQLPAAPFTDGLVSLTATSFPLPCARKHRL